MCCRKEENEMTEQQKSTLKIISAIVTIILLPVLFFHFIGENPTKKVSNATREIAVVNEDTGILKDDGTIDQEALLGNEISASLVDRPDYKWTVVNRSAAESGLSEKQYDAIVYIPSDFSQNILSYNHERPQKAELEFKIQDQLDAVNKEKVQRELQDAQKTVSKKMSSLYWRFVKQGVKKVRKEFDSIVNKESEFQNAMYNFYKPSSNNLAGEVERQKEMIDRLKESINETEGTSKERNASVEESKKQLDSFVDNVNQYKEYQEKQSELLQSAQADSEKQIQDGLTSIKDKQANAQSRFSEQMNGMAMSLSGLQNQFSLTSTSLENLQKTREDQISIQLNGINSIQNKLIDNYQAETRKANLSKLEPDLIALRSNLSKGSEDDSQNGTDPGDEDKNDQDNNQDDEEQPNNLEINLQEQQDELKSIAAELKELSDGLKDSSDNDGGGTEPTPDPSEHPTSEEPAPDQSENPAAENTTPDQNQEPSADTGENGQQDASNPEDPTNDQATGEDGDTQNPGNEQPSPSEGSDDEVAKLKEQLNEAAARLEKVEEDLRAKQDTHNEELKKQLENLSGEITNLNENIEDLKKEIKDLNDDITELKNKRTDDFDAIYNKIQNIEERVSKYLPEDSTLKKAFESNIRTRDVDQLLNYYKLLSNYETAFFGSVNYSTKESVISGTQAGLNTVLKVGETEAEKWENLKNNMLLSNEDIQDYTEGMSDFVTTYGAFIDEKQTETLNELSNISDRANAVSEQLRNPEGAGTAVMQGDATDGTMVISMQDTLGNDILQLSNMLGSLSETQSGVIEYTGNIQESVNDVQKKADTLNSNWGQNVATTKLIRGDVYGILGNAFGGNDGYVYDHLASPVKISGDVPESKAQNVPPVVILVIVMLSSLLIGYFSHHYQNAPLLVRGALFGILNIIVGLMISLFGLNIYSLADDQAVMWSVFTILLLVASSAIIRTAFMLGSIAGGIATAAMVLFYVAPLLDLAMPNFSFNNPVSTVYMSIQYGTGSQFALGIGALILITIIAIAVPFIVNFAKSRAEESETDHDA